MEDRVVGLHAEREPRQLKCADTDFSLSETITQGKHSMRLHEMFLNLDS